MTRYRDLGLTVGDLATGPLNAITDIEGVKVGATTLIHGGDVRTGVTMVVPHEGIGTQPVFAGCHRLNVAATGIRSDPDCLRAER